VAQGVLAPGAQVPLPSHVGGAVLVAPVQEPGPQLDPATTGPQVPSVPCPFAVAEHAWHGPGQALSQHTPSTQ
jgi:hypothetical protein